MRLNLTAMLDVTFQLVIFFILVTNFAAADLPLLELPEPEGSVSSSMGEIRKVVVNVVPFEDGVNDGGALCMIVGGRRIESGAYDELTEILRIEKEGNSEVQVNIRADESLYFEEVEPVIRAIAYAGITRMNIVARMDERIGR